MGEILNPQLLDPRPRELRKLEIAILGFEGSSFRDSLSFLEILIGELQEYCLVPFVHQKNCPIKKLWRLSAFIC